MSCASNIMLAADNPFVPQERHMILRFTDFEK